jgi:light-regulated signal transduction histidine kinase (bacteriophytochrome)
MLEMAMIHQGALISLLSRTHTPEEGARVAKEAEDFFRECLAPFDMTQRGFEESNAALRRVNAKLGQQTAELAIANRELEAFCYSVSHDLHTPLRHLYGFAELLQKHASQTLDEKGLHYLQTISDSAKKMGKLVDDLLLLSRTARAEVRKTRVSLGQLVKEAQEELQHAMAGRDVAWKIGALPEVHGDPSLLRLVMVNLLSNALKFTRTRQRAKIEVSCAPDPKDETVVFVRDNGVGFDMKYGEKLFGIFQRLHSDQAFEGTGVGLANVRRIIQRHGGRTWAEGKVNAGATFYFSLPK